MTAKTNNNAKRNGIAHHHQVTAAAPTSEPRRANKPLMEKRRRARINQSLAALKALILDSAKADNTKHSKLEKADILELTVRHFQRHRSLDTPGVHQYRNGYADCVKEVQRYLETPDAQTMTVLDSGVRQRLLRHLDNCVAEVDMDLKQQPLAPQLPAIEERLPSPPDSSTPHPEEINNNGGRVMEMAHHHHHAHHQDDLKKSSPTSSSYDGNLVFVLPSHYLQIANALGINLRQNEVAPCVKQEPKDVMVLKEEEPDVDMGMQEEQRPLDFSRNNDGGPRDSMWRPW